MDSNVISLPLLMRYTPSFKDETNKDMFGLYRTALKRLLTRQFDLDYDIIAAVIPIALKDIKQALHIGKTLQDLNESGNDL